MLIAADDDVFVVVEDEDEDDDDVSRAARRKGVLFLHIDSKCIERLFSECTDFYELGMSWLEYEFVV